MADNPNIDIMTAYYPIQGANKFETVSFLMCTPISIDLSAATTAAGAQTIRNFPPGAMILGLYSKVTEALAGTGTVDLAVDALSLTVAAAAPVGAYDVDSGPAWTNQIEPLTIQAQTANHTQGAIDVMVIWIPMPQERVPSEKYTSFVAG